MDHRFSFFFPTFLLCFTVLLLFARTTRCSRVYYRLSLTSFVLVCLLFCSASSASSQTAEAEVEENFPYPAEYRFTSESAGSAHVEAEQALEQAQQQEENFPYPAEYQFKADEADKQAHTEDSVPQLTDEELLELYGEDDEDYDQPEADDDSHIEPTYADEVADTKSTAGKFISEGKHRKLFVSFLYFHFFYIFFHLLFSQFSYSFASFLLVCPLCIRRQIDNETN